MLVDDSMKIPDNPATLFLIVCTIMLGFYNSSPKIFKTYGTYIIGFYTLALLYFTYIRLNAAQLTYLAQKQSVVASFLVPIPLFISIWVYEQWKWFQNFKAEKIEAELALLKIQVNPHFFFNTLNNLYALTLKKHDRAPEVVLKLSNSMRYTIYEGKKDNVLLKDELQFLENYIELHKIRYHKTIDIKFTHNIDNKAKVAPLLFIILVENAFKHGAERLTDNAFIKMHLESDAKTIHFSIENNFGDNEQTSSPGIGIDNLKRRLQFIYPKKHEFTIEQTRNIYKSELKLIRND